MAQTVAEPFERERQKVLHQCTKCGICIKKCPILKHTDLKDVQPREIQEKVVDFLNTGIGNDTVYTKAFAYMECYECVSGRCPSGLSPLTINEIIKADYRCNHLADIPYTDPKDRLHSLPTSLL